MVVNRGNRPRPPKNPFIALALYPIATNSWYNISNNRPEMGFLDASYRRQVEWPAFSVVSEPSPWLALSMGTLQGAIL